MFLYDQDSKIENIRDSAGLDSGEHFIPPKCSKCREYLYIAESSQTTQCFNCGKISKIARVRTLPRKVRR